jgi:hypothetical protein
MANRTTYLGLILPGFGEYNMKWYEPLNNNLAAIDAWAALTNQEIVDARMGATTLYDFLTVAHNSDGSLKATDEVKAARNSPVYGFLTPAPQEFSLTQRIDEGDREVWGAREGQSSLREALAQKILGIKNQIVSGSKDGDGYPTWMNRTDSMVIGVNGAVTNLILLIDGHISKIRKLQEITITGSDGLKYLYADYNMNGVVTVDGDATTPPPVAATGTTSADDEGDFTIFSDTEHPDWTIQDVKPGDILTLLDGQDAGIYYIKQVGYGTPSSDNSKLQIVGRFPVGGLSTINYTISDPLAVTLGFNTTGAETPGRIYIGECTVVSGAIDVSSIRPRHFQDSFVSEWRAFDVGSTLTQPETFNHCLGSDLLDISVQVSQVDDGSGPIEELSTAAIDGVSVAVAKGGLDVASTDNRTVGVTAPSFNGGSLAPNTPQVFTPAFLGSLSVSYGGSISNAVSGDPIATVSGGLMSRSVSLKWDRNQVFVQNAVEGVFYTDFDGVARTSGFIRVVARKRG